MVKIYIFSSLRVLSLSALLIMQESLQAAAVTQPHSYITTDYEYSGLPKSNESTIREVNFTNDLGGIVELDLMCQHETLGDREEAYLKYFRQIPITIRAEKEYRVRDGDEINIETNRNWELTINEISNEALLSLQTFREIVLDHFMPKKKVPNFMDTYVWNPCNQLQLFMYRKVIAPLIKVLSKKESTTTITILTEIDPQCDSISLLDIVLDLDKLQNERKLDIQVSHEVLLNMHVTIRAKQQDSLPGSFF